MKKARKIVSREVYNSHKEDQSVKAAMELLRKNGYNIQTSNGMDANPVVKQVVFNSSKPAVKAEKPAKQAKKPAKQAKKPEEKLRIVQYTEKSVAVFGDTKPFRKVLSELKGSFCWGLESEGKGSGSEKQPGWIFSLLRIEQLTAKIAEINAL